MYSLLLFSALSSLLLSFTSAVKVILSYGDEHINPAMAAMNSQTCNNLPPGICCQGRPIPAMLFANPANPNSQWRDYRVAKFTGLETLHIAAVWWQPSDESGCSGTPLDSRPGGGNYRYPTQGSSDVTLTGASYVRLPDHIPKGQKAPMMEAQGILGLITGGGPYIDKKGGTWKRGIRSPNHGVVFAQPPPSAIWPDVVSFDGTEYKQDHVGGSIYTSEEGRVLDFQGK
ncbi:hypothetical protein G7Y79_00008g025340 [Physcia stellaris]|nr:hypothetical protein G7Y79_00008g025340 [Physcia stellaris]